ncbi:MAG: hypothetical protein WAU07_04690 [Microgenomates group bacterium]
MHEAERLYDEELGEPELVELDLDHDGSDPDGSSPDRPELIHNDISPAVDAFFASLEMSHEQLFRKFTATVQAGCDAIAKRMEKYKVSFTPSQCQDLVVAFEEFAATLGKEYPGLKFMKSSQAGTQKLLTIKSAAGPAEFYIGTGRSVGTNGEKTLELYWHATVPQNTYNQPE